MINDFLKKINDKWNDLKSELAVEYYSNIADLIIDQRVIDLDKYIQHHSYTRLRHSLDVSYFSFVVTKLFGWDSRSAARGGLLHDLYHYDWRDEDYVCPGRNHATEHPKIALANAREVCTLNKIEENIILRHMWMITVVPPRYKEGFVVTFVDKYCATREFVISILSRSKGPRSLFTTI